MSIKAGPNQVVKRNSSQASLWQETLDAGHVWQNRFYDFVVRTEGKRVEKLRYIHRNPVKRGLVLEPDQWQRLSCGEGAQGERLSDWACVPVRPMSRSRLGRGGADNCRSPGSGNAA